MHDSDPSPAMRAGGGGRRGAGVPRAPQSVAGWAGATGPASGAVWDTGEAGAAGPWGSGDGLPGHGLRPRLGGTRSLQFRPALESHGEGAALTQEGGTARCREGAAGVRWGGDGLSRRGRLLAKPQRGHAAGVATSPAENVASAPTRHHGDPERPQRAENALACLAYACLWSPSLQETKLRGALGGTEELEETQGRGGGDPKTKSRSRSDYCPGLDISVSKWRFYSVCRELK